MILLLVVAVCGVILIVQMTRLIMRKKLSMSGWITAGAAFLPIAFAVGSAMNEAGTEFNPSMPRLNELPGTTPTVTLH